MLNVVAIMGRLARDPELRQTTTGKNVASFRIACDRGRRDANGQSQADWLDVVAWERSYTWGEFTSIQYRLPR
jgi:single-strand DNA-binding protein